MWNFKKANWPEFSTKVDDQLGDTDDNYSPYILIIKLCDAMRKNAKSAISKGKMHKYKPFWIKELTNQRNTRDQAQEIAEKSEGKDEEQERRHKINWRRECAIMKKQISLSKKEMWN
jgi:hypothetical protein